MTEVRKKRTQNIVVGKIIGVVENKQYPNSSKWVFTDKDGTEYKVSTKSLEYFKDVKPGIAVELVYSEADYGKGYMEFLSSATAVDTRIPEQSADEQFENLKREQMAKGNVPKSDMSKSDWEVKDKLSRKSIERQTSLKAAVEIAIFTGDCDDKVVLGRAKVYEDYLEGKVQPSIVEAAKKLGVVEEDNTPF